MKVSVIINQQGYHNVYLSLKRGYAPHFSNAVLIHGQYRCCSSCMLPVCGTWLQAVCMLHGAHGWQAVGRLPLTISFFNIAQASPGVATSLVVSTRCRVTRTVAG